ncbi:MAG: hypothetical protein JW820_18700 [Spirochaetales bacterium]|nr:hypothetical protein [Spirochaetales bacterium]
MAGKTPSTSVVLYSPDELLSRPIEHAIEGLSCREIAAVIGCSRTAANRILRGDRDLEPGEERRLREWLAAQSSSRWSTDG